MRVTKGIYNFTNQILVSLVFSSSLLISATILRTRPDIPTSTGSTV